MTYEKSLEIIKNEIFDGTEEEAEKIDDEAMAVFMAIKALEKQIPKKPAIKVYDDEDEETHKKYKWKFYVCSVCGENIALKSYTHCHCGQAIDWSDE